MKKEIKILLLIFLLALIIRIAFVYVTPIKYWDETVYANLGYHLSQSPFDYSLKNTLWSDFIPSAGNVNYSWPKIGFRAPLFSYFLGIFYLFRADFLIDFLMPLIGALCVVLVYFLGNKLFNEKVGLYSAVLLCFIPLEVIFSAKILTDIFFTFLILFSVLFFWKGFEENKNKYKLLFGIFLGISILSRYTGLWFIPIFILYLMIRSKGFKFLKDKYFWFSFLLIILILSPLFIYSFFTYGNVFGSFIHGSIASNYWGDNQVWYYLFKYWYSMFSIIGFVFLVGLFYIFYKKDYLKKEIYFLLIWFIVFLFFVIVMPHKEDRLLLPIVPAMCLICGYFLSKIRKYKLFVLLIIILICSYSLGNYYIDTFHKSYTLENSCFLKETEFIRNLNSNSKVFGDQSSIIYYYTKKEVQFYPNPWSADALIQSSKVQNKEMYALVSSGYLYSNNIKSDQIKSDLENVSKLAYSCEDGGAVYRII